MEKIAKARQRAPRKDQDQESILKLKDEINARTSRLIELLKKTKSGLNGGPSPEIGVEKYRLIDPMPSAVQQSGQLASQELNSILDGIRQADQMQDEYAAERERRLSERVQKMNQIQQEASMDAKIKKEASNKLTRLWANIVAPFGSENGKSERLSMLNALGRIDRNLQDVEDKVLSTDPSVLDAIHLSKNLYADAKTTFFQPFRKNLNQMLEVSKNSYNELSSEIKELEKRIAEKEKYIAQKNKKDEIDLKKIKPLSNYKTDNITSNPNVELPKEEKEPSKQELGKSTFIKNKPIPPINLESDKKQKVNVDIPDVKPEVIEPIPEESIPEVIQPLSKEIDEEIIPVIENAQEVVEEIVPEVTPEISENERSVLYRKHLVENIQQLYKEVFQLISSMGFIEDPWDERIRKQWSALNAQADYVYKLITSAIPEGADIINYIEKQHIQYLIFIKLVGDVKASINAYKYELNLLGKDDNFVLGSSLDEKSLQDQALNFTETYRKELQTISDINHSLVSFGSNRFTRMLKRFRTQLSWGKNDRTLRLSVDQKLQQSRKDLQQIMNNLEKRNIDFRSLISDSTRFYDGLIDVYSGLASLGEMYNSRMFMEKSKHKSEKTRMPYDTIRDYDIRAMNSISKELQRDKDNINNLYWFEDNTPDLESKLHRLREKADGFN